MSLNVLPELIGTVRRAVAEQLGLWGYESVTDDAALVITELLANVHEHAQGRCVLRLHPADGELFITVSDTVANAPRVTPRSATSVMGRGMHLVDSLTDHWEAVITSTGKDVKCRMSLPRRRAGR
ncbi:ATP-binding protein [Streptomyces pathocidini]|uniref:ATP-binding protein n=2 Tax=Streptomyces pathocidini TaxID=1650571 RepID=A0ABW7UP29_9ACTN